MCRHTTLLMLVLYHIYGICLSESTLVHIFFPQFLHNFYTTSPYSWADSYSATHSTSLSIYAKLPWKMTLPLPVWTSRGLKPSDAQLGIENDVDVVSLTRHCRSFHSHKKLKYGNYAHRRPDFFHRTKPRHDRKIYSPSDFANRFLTMRW